MLPPIGAVFIAGIGQAIASVPADEVMIVARPAIVSQEPAGCTGGTTKGHTKRRHVIFGVCGPGMPELYQPVQGLEYVHRHLLSRLGFGSGDFLIPGRSGAIRLGSTLHGH